MKYSVVTFGCRVNQADSLAFEEQLLACGASTASPDEADLVVVNTCSVTAGADQGARQTIRRIARANPAARIVVTGCYATRRPDEVRHLPGVVSVVPNGAKPLMWGRSDRSRWVDEAGVGLWDCGSSEGDATTAARYGDGEGACGAAIEPGSAGRTTFTLRVQTGCAEPCTYCIIPRTRGAPRSVPVADVRREVERIVSVGFKEIVLTGVHLGSYGRDLRPHTDLAELLRALSGFAAEQPPNSGRRGVRFRVSSLEPMDCTPEVVSLVAEHECLAPHLHLPLQHASNRVLAGMRRPYTIELYAALVSGIRARIPDAAIGSDVVVGFPGETESDFDELVAYLERSPLTHLHVFPYSDRPGTVASTMGGKVPGPLIRERSQRLRDISSRLSRQFRATQIGILHRGLTLEDGSLVLTGNYLKLRIPPGRLRNEWVQVRALDAGETTSAEVM